MRTCDGCLLDEIKNLHSGSAAEVTNPPVRVPRMREEKGFLNPDTAQFIVVFNNVWPTASWRSCPRCIYFLSDAPPNNPVIPCGPTTQTAAMRPPSPAPPGPLPRPPRRHSKTHSPALLRPRCPSLSPAAAPLLLLLLLPLS